MTKIDIKHYITVHKEHENRRASTNERSAYWKNYLKTLKGTRAETSFDMNRFSQ
jgi:hypothetical protein